MNKQHFEVIGDRLGLSKEVVEKTYKAYWLFIKTTIEALSLNDISEEEFNNIKTNFNIPSLGKLSCNYAMIKKIKNGKNIKDNKH